jgi:peptidoglycan hydrolase-like protein with peptidoglycan-binding domain
MYLARARGFGPLLVVVMMTGLVACGGDDTGARSRGASGLDRAATSAPPTSLGATTSAGPTTSAVSTTVAETSTSLDTTETTVPAADVFPLKVGSEGPEVAQLQSALERAGYDVGESGADGKFGPDTADGVSAFQREHGLAATGQADRALLTTIEAAAPARLLVLDAGGLGEARLGDDPDSVLAYLTRKFGSPTTDDGWQSTTDGSFGACGTPEIRAVNWPSLAVFFAPYDVGAGAAGPRQLISLQYGFGEAGAPFVPRLRTDRGLRPRDTVSRLIRLYPAAVVDPGNEAFGPSFSVPGDIRGTIVAGPPDRVGVIEVGSIPCGE